MTPLSYLSALRVSGADAGKFLQSQVAAQLAELKSPFATFSAYCSARGQVIATLLLAPREGHWLLVAEASLVAIIQARMQKYILRDDVRLESLGEHFLCGVDPAESELDRVTLLNPNVLPIQYAISTVQAPADPEALADWRRSELLLGIPWLNLASTERYIPQMLGIDAIGAVSFSKGCYPGQEIIARARHLGEVKRRPQVLDLEGPQAPDVNSPCFIRTTNGQSEATVVHCVSTGKEAFTVFCVAALNPGDAVKGLEQNGHCWSATRALRE